MQHEIDAGGADGDDDRGVRGGARAGRRVHGDLTVHHRLAPPTINVGDPDDTVELDVVRDAPSELLTGPVTAVSNSSGFGGHNVVAAFRAAF